MSNFSISPCLFIGLGSNGWNIIDDLRRLLFEEFGVAGLHCFRFLALETNNERQEDNSFLPHSAEAFERVRPIYITVPDISVVKGRLDPRLTAEYVPGLVEWLDESLIDRGNKSYTAGAGHQRQAGRLCLWENWSRNGNVSGQLRELVGQLRTVKPRDDADAFLRSEYFKKKKPGLILPQENVVSGSPKVYIFGTLCGGTCSGTFLDIAYYVSKLLGVNGRANLRKIKHPEVIGLFTVPDTLRMHATNHHSHVANCWAALRELDYCFQPESRYQVQFPDGEKIETRDEPFDSVYLASMMTRSKAGFVGEDWRSLNQLCAMNLFTEVVAGMAATKDEIRVNFRAGDAGFLERNQVGNIRALSAFGLSAIWYPRYRIANAIVRRLGVEMCDGLQGSTTLNANLVEADAERFWSQLIERARGSLIGSVNEAHCPINLEQEIVAAFTSYESSFLNLDEDGLSSYLNSFPPDGVSFSDRLKNPDGSYYLKMANAEPLVTRDIRSGMRNIFSEYLGSHSTAEARVLIMALTRRASELDQAISDNMPILSQSIDLRISPDVHSDWPSLLLFKRRDAIREYKMAIWSELRQRVVRHLKEVQENLFKRVLSALRQEILSLSARLSNMEVGIRLLRQTCIVQADQQITFKHASNIIPISKQDPATIQDDVDTGVSEVMKANDRSALRERFLRSGSDGPLDRFESNSVEELMPLLDRAFAPLAQQIISDFDIGDHSLAHLRSKVNNLVVSSEPYIELVGAFVGINVPQSPNFLFCHDLVSGGKMAEFAKADLVGPGFIPSKSPLDHFIIFYQELPGLAISDLQISAFASEALRQREDAPDRVATAFLHKAGERMFNVRARQQLHKLKQWLRACDDLAPEVFSISGQDRYLQFTGEQGLPDLLLVSKDSSIAEFTKRRGVDLVFDHLKAEFRKIGRETLLPRMEVLRNAAPNIEEMKRILDMHKELLEDTFGQ